MAPAVGDEFRPWRRFNGVMIPDPVVASDLSMGAKVCYGRLARCEGKVGYCYPSMNRVGEWMGVSGRQVSAYIAELEGGGYIRRKRRGRGQTNRYAFLWHRSFIDVPERKCASDQNGTSLPPKRITDGEVLDLDSSPSNRKNRDSTASEVSEPQLMQYPTLREALCEYMMTDSDDERIYPKNRLVVDVMDAACGATEREVVECLRYLRFERGLAYGKRNSPRKFAWFKTAVHDYFTQRRNREKVIMPIGYTDWLPKEEFEGTGAAFDPTSH